MNRLKRSRSVRLLGLDLVLCVFFLILSTLALAVVAQDGDRDRIVARLTELRAAAAADGVFTQAEAGAMLNHVAWEFRGNGWGLSRKSGGHNCPSLVGLIACDILSYRPNPAVQERLFDVLHDNGVMWLPAAYHGSPTSRPWVAPADPGGEPPPPPPACDWPDQRQEVAQLRDETAIQARRIAELDAEANRLRDTLAAVTNERDEARRERDAAVEALARVRCTFDWSRFRCRLVQ